MQEASDWLCDRGSSVAILKREFAFSGTQDWPVLDFSTVPEDWNSKQGPWAPTAEALTERAARVRKWLNRRREREIVVVTHAGFLTWLTGEEAEFGNAEWRSYRFDDDREDAMMPMGVYDRGSGKS